MERTRKGVVLPSDFGWSDIGSWKSLYDFLPKDSDQNVIDGDVIARNTQNCFILGWDRLIATNHLKNVVVVETPDSIFVSDIDHSRDVKSIVTLLKEEGRKEYHQHRTVHLPWGSRTLLEQKDDFCVSRAIVYPAAAIRADLEPAEILHLVVLKGEACIYSGGRKYYLHVGDSTTLSADTGLSIANSGDQLLYLLQVQIGGKPDAH
jgi:mannose-6-phosphate isomerase-like protein (cupin superfamily)